MTENFDFNESGYVANSDFNFGFSIAIYKILAGQSINFTSIWADVNANLQTAKMYIGSYGSGAALSVVDLSHKVLIDSYLIDKSGEYDELLSREDIVDINVSTMGS